MMPNRLRTLSLSLLIALLALPLHADESEEVPAPPEEVTEADVSDIELKPMEATYRARLKRGVSVRGEAVRSLEEADNGQWLYRFDVDSFIADIRESTRLNFDGRRVQPLEYRYSLEGFMIRNRADSYDFDWEKLELHDLEDDRVVDFSDVPELQDQLGAQLQLWVDLKAGKERMEYVIPDNGDFRDYEFQILREETLKTDNFGEVDTVLVERVREEDSPRTTHMWFVPEWDYLLVRLEQTHEDGEDFEIYLQEADLHDQKIRP